MGDGLVDVIISSRNTGYIFWEIWQILAKMYQIMQKINGNLMAIQTVKY